eukprot:UN09969
MYQRQLQYEVDEKHRKDNEEEEEERRKDAKRLERRKRRQARERERHMNAEARTLGLEIEEMEEIYRLREEAARHQGRLNFLKIMVLILVKILKFMKMVMF